MLVSANHKVLLFKESNLSQLVLEQKSCYYHLIGHQGRPVNFLSTDVGFLSDKA